MILDKVLILKGLAGVTVLAGATTLGLGIKNNWWKKPSTEFSPLQLQASLMEKAGLTCDSSSRICSLKENKTITFKQNTNTSDEISTIPSTAGKIKLKEGSVNNQENPEFIVSEGDITLTNTNGGTITKLEQFETYEIEEVTEESNTKKYYLKRKSDAKEGIRVALGLPSSCNLPESSNENNGSNCESISSEDLKAINFDGKQAGGATIESAGTTTLTITKVSDNNYPFGYKFSIQPTQKLTISSASPENSIAPNVGVEFKIKKTSGTNQISLEKAWTLQTLAAKAGLENCNNNNECSIKVGSLNVKHDETKEENKTKSTSSVGTQGKIKVYKDTSNHKEGFKFVIEDGDIALSNDSGSISKLEQFETYEIEETDGKYYLSRKTKAFKEISKALGLPGGCDEIGSNNQASCTNLDQSKLQGINFDGKGSNAEVEIKENSGSNINLKVSKTTDTTIFPNGYKFVLESDKEINIPKTSPTLTIKKNTNTEFKIKVTTDNGTKTLSLEKAWDINKLAEKIKLTSCDASKKECSLPTNKNINVILDSDYKKENATIQEADANKKLKYDEDQEGYNQGIRFYAEEDINLDDSKKIDKKGEENTSAVYYEIKEQTVGSSTTWYLSKKTNTKQST